MLKVFQVDLASKADLNRSPEMDSSEVVDTNLQCPTRHLDIDGIVDPIGSMQGSKCRCRSRATRSRFPAATLPDSQGDENS